MTQFVIERSPVTSGLLTMLRTFLLGVGTGATDVKVEVGEAPRDINANEDGQLIDPYSVIYPLSALGAYGSMAHPDDGARLPYQITSVGRTDESAGIQADRIRRGILERAASGSFVRPISAGASMTVIDRRVVEFGILTPQVGRWTVIDSFDLEVQAHA